MEKITDIEILESLMEMCNQYLSKTEDTDSLVHHSFMASGENALDLLERAGLAETEDDVDYKLLWDKLKEMKKPCELCFHKDKVGISFSQCNTCSNKNHFRLYNVELKS